MKIGVLRVAFQSNEKPFLLRNSAMGHSGSGGPFDLEERTAKFGEDVIRFAKTIPQNVITMSLISQLARSGSSVGRITLKLMTHSPKKVFATKSAFAKRKPERLNTGSAC